MTAGLYNFTIEQGADFSRTFTWRDQNGDPINLTGYTGASQIRDNNGNLLIDFLVDGSIVFTDPSAGQVTISLPNSFTSSLNFDTASWDMKLTGSGLKNRFLQGAATLSPQVTE